VVSLLELLLVLLLLLLSRARSIDSEFLTAAKILEKLAKIQKLIIFLLM
jgi:hypothetical protein